MVEAVDGRLLDEQRLRRRLVVESSGVDDLADEGHVALHELVLRLLETGRVALQQLRGELLHL